MHRRMPLCNIEFLSVKTFKTKQTHVHAERVAVKQGSMTIEKLSMVFWYIFCCSMFKCNVGFLGMPKPDYIHDIDVEMMFQG